MVEVHHFKIWNIYKDDWGRPPSKRTAESIAELRGQVIPDTAEDIFSHQLDDHGRYFPLGRAVQVETPLKDVGLKGKR